MSEIGFKYSILASGSTGNCFYIETPQKRLLIDAGLTGKKVTSLLAEINRKPEDLDAILVTHEHSDHIKGVGVLARKYHLDIYANEQTWKVMDERNMLGKVDVSQKHVFGRGKTLTFGDLDIESFGVSHDAVDPQFYRMMKDDKSFVMKMLGINKCSSLIIDALKVWIQHFNIVKEEHASIVPDRLRDKEIKIVHSGDQKAVYDRNGETGDPGSDPSFFDP